MPFTQNGYEKRTADDIYDDLATRFEANNDEDVVPGSLTDRILQTEADVLANYQEEMADRLYDSAFLTLASDDELTLKAKEVGVNRKEAVGSTGVVSFISNEPVTNTYTISRGTVVQTGGSDPLSFNTTESVSLSYLDGFEDGSITEYTGDTADFSVVQTHAYEGNDELTCGATSSSQIIDTGKTSRIGDKIHVHVYNEADTISTFLYGVQDLSNYYEVTVDSVNNLLELAVVEGGTSTTLASSSATIPTGEYLEVEVDWSTQSDHTISLKDNSGTDVISVSELDDNTFISGGIGFGSKDATASKYWDEVSKSRVASNIKARSGGVNTNIPSNAIVQMPSPPAGVDSVTNPVPTGNRSYTGTEGVAFVVGRNRENDNDLRNRALNSLTGGGAATGGAIYTAISNIGAVNSVSLFVNESSTDNTGSGGLPPYSTEVVVYGGEVSNIVETLYETMSLIDFLRLYAGAHGTEETYDVVDEQMDEIYTGRITRPTKLDVDIVVDITIRSEQYAGDEEVKSSIVNFVGGITAENQQVIGLGVGEDLYKEELGTEVNEISGVVGISNMILDTTGDGNDDSTTINGLAAVDVAKSEVIQTNVNDGDVTVNTTTI